MDYDIRKLERISDENPNDLRLKQILDQAKVRSGQCLVSTNVSSLDLTFRRMLDQFNLSNKGTRNSLFKIRELFSVLRWLVGISPRRSRRSYTDFIQSFQWSPINDQTLWTLQNNDKTKRHLAILHYNSGTKLVTFGIRGINSLKSGIINIAWPELNMNWNNLYRIYSLPEIEYENELRILNLGFRNWAETPSLDRVTTTLEVANNWWKEKKNYKWTLLP